MKHKRRAENSSGSSTTYRIIDNKKKKKERKKDEENQIFIDLSKIKENSFLSLSLSPSEWKKRQNFELNAGQTIVYESKRSARHSPAVVVAVLAAAAPGCCCCCDWNIAVGWRNKDPYIMFSSDCCCCCCCWLVCWLPGPTTGELPIPAAPLLPPGTIGAPGVGGTRLPSSTATRTDSMCRRENTCS